MYNLQQKKDLALLTRQASELASKRPLTPEVRAQHANVLAKIAMINKGATLAELDRDDVNEVAARNGLPQIQEDRMSAEDREIATGFKKWIVESRVAETGIPQTPIASMNGSAGSFVPTQFFYNLFEAQKAVDPLLDRSVVTLVETAKGGPLAVPLLGDTEESASIIGENASGGQAPDLSKPSSIVLGGYTFRTKPWPVTLEAFQDVAVAGGVINLFKRVAAGRMARGVSAKLLGGSGVGEPTGLLTALAALGVNPIIATGSSDNTGGAQTGANSIGSADIANLVYALDESYRKSDKCAFLMSDNTREALAGVVTKQGVPLLQWQGPDAWMMGYKVLTSPSMPSIGAAATTVLFGDLSYFVVRNVTGGARLQVIREAPGYVEKGLVGLQVFERFDCGFGWDDYSGSQCPVQMLQQHS